MTQETLSSLRALGAQLRLRLNESPEFRALTVIDRTIRDLSEILNLSAPPAAPVEESAREPSATISSIRPHAGTAAPGPTSSQSRMATAIAEAIAAKAASPNTPATTAPRFNHALRAAS
jgi:hypothetical protein